jgi:hypothetical protein
MVRAPGVRTCPIRLVAIIAAGVLAVSMAGCGTSANLPSTVGRATSGSAAVAPPAVTQDLAVQGGVAKEAAVVPQPGGSGSDASKIPAAEKLIVRNKTLRMEVKDVEGTIAKIRDLVKRDGADVQQLQVATSLDEPIYRPIDAASGSSASNLPLRAFVTIRVPADKYQAFIDDAAKLGDVKFQTESADDVTQQHVDLKARLDNLRAEEAQLREFFLKAKNVTEMLQIESELGRVRGEIESLAAPGAYLERQAAMATVPLELTEPKALVRPAGIDWGVGSAFTQSVRAFVGTLNVLIVMLGPILALGLFLVLPAFLIARAIWKRYKRHQASKADGRPEQPPADGTA